MWIPSSVILPHKVSSSLAFTTCRAYKQLAGYLGKFCPTHFNSTENSFLGHFRRRWMLQHLPKWTRFGKRYEWLFVHEKKTWNYKTHNSIFSSDFPSSLIHQQEALKLQISLITAQLGMERTKVSENIKQWVKLIMQYACACDEIFFKTKFEVKGTWEAWTGWKSERRFTHFWLGRQGPRAGS